MRPLCLPTPLHTRFPARGVALSRGGRKAGSGRTIHAACAGHRPRGPRPDRVCRARPCSGSAGRSGEWGCSGIAFPCPGWTDGEGGDPVPSAPLFCVRGGSGCGPPPPIWESVAWGRGKMDGLATLNQALMRGLSSCRRIFGGRAHFSASLPLLVFVKNVSLLNPSLDPACTGGVSRPG